MDINLKDVQKWYADKINKQVIELDSYDLFCAKVAYDYACEQLTIPAVVEESEQLVCDNHRADLEHFMKYSESICKNCKQKV